MGEVPQYSLMNFPSFRYFPPVYYYLGRVQEALGSDAAADSYKKYLSIKENADEEDPMVEEARKRIGQL